MDDEKVIRIIQVEIERTISNFYLLYLYVISLYFLDTLSYILRYSFYIFFFLPFQQATLRSFSVI